jgi:hypothetical protein
MCILHPFCAAAWSFDKTLKSLLSSDQALLPGSSRFCIRDRNLSFCPFLFVTPSFQNISLPSVTFFGRNRCIICLHLAPFRSASSLFGSMWCRLSNFSDLSNIHSHSPVPQNDVSGYQLYHKQECESECRPGLLNPTGSFQFTALDQR